MAETLGSLIDKLTIVNVKCFHMIDDHADKSLPDAERLKAADDVRELNSQRNELIQEIDEFLQAAIDGEVKVSRRIVKKYKDGLQG